MCATSENQLPEGLRKCVAEGREWRHPRRRHDHLTRLDGRKAAAHALAVGPLALARISNTPSPPNGTSRARVPGPCSRVRAGEQYASQDCNSAIVR
jgi:hypothetical protein